MTPKLLSTLHGYTRAAFIADALAGVSVALVAMPLSLAIAIASGAAPQAGLVTAVVAGLLISLFGGSRVQIGGPTGAFIVVVFGVIADHGYDGLVLATLMAGIILLIAALLRAGRLIALVPEAVINGFTIGIAIIIATSQIRDFGGLPVAQLPAAFLPKIEALLAVRSDVNWTALTIGMATLVMIVMLRRRFPRFPGLIVAVGLGSALVTLADLPVGTIASGYGPLPSHLPWPQLPAFDSARIIELLPSALVIAFLAGVESLLSAMVADRMIEGHHRPNAELLAQGIGNIGSALFGGLPATGAIARTATNVSAGGRTPVAGIVHALVILLIMMSIGPLAGYLAMPALAAILLVAAWNMSEPHKWRHYLSAPWPDRLLLLLTLTLTVLADLTVAIGTGVAVGLLLRLRDRGREEPDWDMPER